MYNKNNKVSLHVPGYDELWFRQRILSDPETMSYNNAWGGTIPFPEEEWRKWYDRWINPGDERRYYRYVAIGNSKFYVGEVAYHFSLKKNYWLIDVIIYAKYCRKGYGREALCLLCEEARKNGITELRDNIAIDNPGIKMFKQAGFVEEYRTNEIIMLKKTLLPFTTSGEMN